MPQRNMREITYLDRINTLLQNGTEIRITLIGVSGSGKTAFQQTTKAVMTQEPFEILRTIGIKGGHGTQSLTQTIIPLPKDSKIIITDFKGLDYTDGNVQASAKDIQDMYIGIFPYHLVNETPIRRLFRSKIIQKFQHHIVVVISADELGDHLNYIAMLANKIRHLPFFIVLTHVDKLTPQKVEEVRETVVQRVKLNACFIIPIPNCTMKHQVPSEQTVLGVHEAVAEIVKSSLEIQNDFQPTIWMYLESYYRNNKRWISDLFSSFLKNFKSPQHLSFTNFLVVVLLAIVAVLWYCLQNGTALL